MNQTNHSIAPNHFKRPLTLVVAVFFFLTAIAPLWILFSETHESDLTTTTTAATKISDTATVSDKSLTATDKIEAFAKAIEKACYSDDSLDSRAFALSCTKILLGITIISSLLFATGLVFMYFSPSTTETFKSAFSIACTSAVALGALMLLALYANSTLNIIERLSKIPTDAALVNEKLKDAAKTEHLFFLFRNIAIIAGLALLIYRLPLFAFRSILAKNSTLKVLKNAKRLSSAYTAVALICCFYITTISLTWEFNFITKSLLLMSVMFATLCFMMIALLSDLRQHLKNSIIAEQKAKEAAAK